MSVLKREVNKCSRCDNPATEEIGDNLYCKRCAEEMREKNKPRKINHHHPGKYKIIKW